MEFLRKQGVAYQEVDVTKNPLAAQEMVRRTGQMGVPVITDSQEAIVGFDLPRLQRMAARHSRPGLGLRGKDAEDGPGATRFPRRARRHSSPRRGRRSFRG